MILSLSSRSEYERKFLKLQNDSRPKIFHRDIEHIGKMIGERETDYNRKTDRFETEYYGKDLACRRQSFFNK